MRWRKKGQRRRVIERQRAEETGGGGCVGEGGGGASKSQFNIMGGGDRRHVATGGKRSARPKRPCMLGAVTHPPASSPTARRHKEEKKKEKKSSKQRREPQQPQQQQSSKTLPLSEPFSQPQICSLVDMNKHCSLFAALKGRGGEKRTNKKNQGGKKTEKSKGKLAVMLLQQDACSLWDWGATCFIVCQRWYPPTPPRALHHSNLNFPNGCTRRWQQRSGMPAAPPAGKQSKV